LGDAILEGDLDEIRKELGDVLLHIVFYSRIGSEKGSFDLGDVAHSVSEKLIHRHPHIYGDVDVSDSEEVKRNWEQIKLKEGKKSVLEGVPRSLPALVKSHRIQEKAAGVGFDWKKRERVWDKVEEEWKELRQAVEEGDPASIEDEYGDTLFSMVNFARFIDVNPENALERTNQKFMRRFRFIEDKAREQGRDLQSMELDELEAYWQEAKKQEVDT
jgi:XTP/dITP diphosphohydrolase